MPTRDAAHDVGTPTVDADRDVRVPTADAADANTRPDAEVIDCTRSVECPQQWCEFRCCPGPGECAPCCAPKMCQAFAAADCPVDRCQLRSSCAGPPICYPQFSAPPPACGGVGYYGGAVACCSSLVLRCGAVMGDGSCDMTAGGYIGMPWCIACGDGDCYAPFENRCSCPEDCQ